MEQGHRVVQGQSLQNRPLREIIEYQRILHANVLDFPLVMERRLQNNTFFNGIKELDGRTESLSDDREQEYDEGIADRFNQDDMGHRMQGDGPLAHLPDERNKYLSTEATLRDDLEVQMNLFGFADQQKELGLFFYDSLNANGFLNSYHNPVSYLVQLGEHSEQLITSTLAYLQDHVVPAGLFATDVKHSLQLQAARLPETIEKVSLMKIIDLRFNDLMELKLDDLRTLLRLDNYELLNDVYELVEKMQPFPLQRSDTATSYKGKREPDFTLTEKDGVFVARLTEGNSLTIRVDQQYKQRMAVLEQANRTDDPEYSFYRKENSEINRAIFEIADRNKRLEEVASYMANEQAKYLREGNEFDLQPLLEKDVAEKFGVSPSTISRIANDKYFQMESGAIVSMVQLLSLGSQKRDGLRVAVQEVREQLFNLIKKENHNAPKTPMELKKEMDGLGYKISVNTIRKMCEEANIPDVRERKNMYSNARENNMEVFKLLERMNLKLTAMDHEVVNSGQIKLSL